MSTVSREHLALTPRQREMLSLLSRRKQWSVGEIAAVLGVSSAAATKAVIRLERRGLVSRSENQLDRRCVDVRLTSEATASVKQFPASISSDQESEEMSGMSLLRGEERC